MLAPPSSAAAAADSSLVDMMTKPKPRERPVSRSLMTCGREGRVSGGARKLTHAAEARRLRASHERSWLQRAAAQRRAAARLGGSAAGHARGVRGACLRRLDGAKLLEDVLQVEAVNGPRQVADEQLALVVLLRTHGA